MKEDLRQNKSGTEKHRPSNGFKRLKKFRKDYKKRYFYMIINKRKRGDRLLGQNSIKFLLLSLQRSRLMFEALLDCLKHKQRAVAYLVVRAHFETTGLVSYFYKHLGRFYNNEIGYDEIDSILRGLTLAGKTFPDKKKQEERNIPDAINVLTLIGAADKLFNSISKEKKNIFRDCYDFLSEFCHPNWLGLTIGSDIVDWNKCIFAKKPTFKKRDLGILVHYLCISSVFFFTIYDKCFAIVKEREVKDMPELLKSFPSAIWTVSK